MGQVSVSRTIAAVAIFAAIGTWISSCGSTPNAPVFAKTSRFHAQAVPDGSLRLAVHVATRDELVSAGWGYDVLISAGIPDGQIQDGSAIVGRVNCCGGPNEQATAIYAFVPDDIRVSVGDVVEIWSGKMVAENDPLGSWPNTVTRIVGKGTNGPCRWTPDDPRLWARELYCDWMPVEGWVKQSGLHSYWVKPIEASTPPTY